MVKLASTSTTERRRYIAAIHASAAKLGMDTADKNPQSDYRSMLAAVGGATSTTDMDDAALKRVVRHLQQTLNPGRQVKPADGWHAEKMRRVWAELAALGALRDATDHGLNAFVFKTTQKAAPRFLTSVEGNRVVEALKAWRDREKAKRRESVTP